MRGDVGRAMLDQLDAVAAAGEHHRVIFENDHVRVLDTIIRPGEQTALHTHVWAGTLQIISWSEFERFDQQGHLIFASSQLSSRPPIGAVLWSEALAAHSFRNIGTQDFHVISTELKTQLLEG